MRLLKLMFCFMLGLLSNPLLAEQFFEDDQYRVHYSAFNTTQISADILKRYGITRSRQRGMINLAVQRKRQDGQTVPVEAMVSGYATFLNGSEQKLDFHIVSEKHAIYYLAEFIIADGEQLNFKLKVTPYPGYPPLVIPFSQVFYKDDL